MRAERNNRLSDLARKAIIPISLALASFLPQNDSLARDSRRAERFSAAMHQLPCPDGKKADPSLHTEVSGGVVRFREIGVFYCNSIENVRFGYSRKGNSITISENFRGVPAPCVCSFEIGGKITDLPSGTYKLTFIFDNRQPTGRGRRDFHESIVSWTSEAKLP